MLKARLYNQIKQHIITANLSPRIQQDHLYWIRAFMRFHQFVNPQLLNSSDIRQFISHLQAKAVGKPQQLAAVSAINFLYRHILNKPLGQPAMTTHRTCQPRFAA